MIKKELITKATQVLKDNHKKKPVQIKKNTFHITDDEGNSADFVVKQDDKSVIYTFDDVSNILDAILFVIEDSLKQGEDVIIRGFGTFGLSHRKPKLIRNVTTGEISEVKEHYAAKFQCGYGLKMAAKIYELMSKDRQSSPILDEESTGGDN